MQVYPSPMKVEKLFFYLQDEEIGKLKSRYGDMESSYNQVKCHDFFSPWVVFFFGQPARLTGICCILSDSLTNKGASCQRCLLSDRHKHRFNNSLRRSRSFGNNSLWLRVRRNLFSLFHFLVSFSFPFVEIMSIFSGLYCAAFQPQSSGVTESFFTENVELTNLRNQVSDLQLSRDSLQEDVKTKDEKIGKLVSATLRSSCQFCLLALF